ncbi:type II CAAX endopeptidase family protein [Sphingomonas sp.]|uniref:CPBP family intramembrane glutamic endopeptidase n=1 Tax=Sphingomonas sp. TaxID=28214 RepID=UPI0025D1EB40|nr:type II CAAX endopeptidase family protein [Sphingomonas sp.]MBV9529289.1 CPBP family intramembrane metalloprotease [Sphingomonas sp.]
MTGLIERSVAEQRPTWKRIVQFPLVAMVIAILVVLLCFTACVLLAEFVLPAIPGFSQEMKFDLIAMILLVAAYLLVIRRLGRYPRNDYRDPAALRRLGLGLFGGLAIFSASVAVAALLGVYRITGEGDFSGLLPALTASAIFPAINEEMLFRGILFRWIEEFGGSWLALFVTSGLFGAAHLMNPNASPIAAVGIAFEAGVMLGAAYMLTRSLWLPMGLHAAWNFAQGEIWDIPVSGTKVHGIVVARLAGDPLLTGNGFGLEASLICIVVATLFGLWLLWLAIRKGELKRPMWSRENRLASQSSS